MLQSDKNKTYRGRFDHLSVSIASKYCLDQILFKIYEQKHYVFKMARLEAFPYENISLWKNGLCLDTASKCNFHTFCFYGISPTVCLLRETMSIFCWNILSGFSHRFHHQHLLWSILSPKWPFTLKVNLTLSYFFKDGSPNFTELHIQNRAFYAESKNRGHLIDCLNFMHFIVN